MLRFKVISSAADQERLAAIAPIFLFAISTSRFPLLIKAYGINAFRRVIRTPPSAPGRRSSRRRLRRHPIAPSRTIAAAALFEPRVTAIAPLLITRWQSRPTRSTPTRTQAAIVYQAKGDRDRALAHYTKAIEIIRYAEAHVGRGIIYRARGDSDRAIADYSQAIEINPQLVNA